MLAEDNLTLIGRTLPGFFCCSGFWGSRCRSTIEIFSGSNL